MLRLFSLLAFLAITALAAAQETYSVDSSGGPLTLPEEVQDAFSQWLDAGAGSTPAESDGADTAFRFGSPELLGPDTVTLTLQRADRTPGLEVIVQPDLYRDYPAALLHEAGLTLGLTVRPEGVMRAGLTEGAEAVITAGDVSNLRSAALAVPGDLTGDGVVDFHDLLELAGQFGQRGFNLPADLDGDGIVTMDDLTELRQLYTFLPPADPADQDDQSAPEVETEDAEPESAPAADEAAEPESVEPETPAEDETQP